MSNRIRIGYPTYIFGILLAAISGWFAGKSTHDCPVTVEYVASDTIPPVTRGWVIEGDSVMAITFGSYETHRDWEYEFDGDPIRIRGYGGWSLLSREKSYRCSDVYADRTLAEAELCRRLDAQAAELAKKREGICED